MEKPFQLFQNWFKDAQEKEIHFPEAMTLSSVNKDGSPSSRILLLKKITPEGPEKGFIFFTNMNSRKSQELIQNPKTSICFHWKSLCRQVRIEGLAHKVSDQEANHYFSTRPRQSQIGAWASDQSSSLKSMSALEKEVKRISEKFSNQEIPRPHFWSGFRIDPHYFEFWTEKPFRLHERISFSLINNDWTEELLCP